MTQVPAIDEMSVTGGTVTDPRLPDFHAFGVAGCIDRLAEPLRRQGTVIRWETPHHGIEITAASAVLLYHAA